MIAAHRALDQAMAVQPSADDIPFVLLHGAWVLRIALALLVILVLLVAVQARRIATRTKSRRRLREMQNGDRHTIRGTLGAVDRGPVAATVSVSRPRTIDERAHWRAKTVWIETSEGRVFIDGPIVVELGSSGTSSRHGVPKMVDELDRAARQLPSVIEGNYSCTTTAVVSVGDEVIAWGRLQQVPRAAEAGYREASVANVLRPRDPDEHSRVTIAALTPGIVLPRMSALVALILSLATAFGGYELAAALGDRWYQECGELDFAHRDTFVELHATNRCVMVAATPGGEDRALEWAHHALERSPARDDRSLARLLELTRRVEGCAAVLNTLEDNERSQDVLEQAKRCGQGDALSALLVAEGRFEEAAALAPDPDLQILIAARRWIPAAEMIDQRGQRTYERCLSQLFRHYGGDSAALGHLEILAKTDDACLPIVAEAAPPRERFALVSKLERSTIHREIEMLAFLEGTRVPHTTAGPEEVLVRLGDATSPRDVIFAFAAPHAAHNAAVDAQAVALRWRAVAHVLAGEHREAAEVARLAVDTRAALASPVSMSATTTDTSLLPATVALYTPTVDAVQLDRVGIDMLDPESRARYADSRLLRFDRLALRANAARAPSSITAIEVARLGDGATLVKAIQRIGDVDDGDVLAVLPHLKTGRDELMRWLAQSQPRQQGTSPLAVATRAAVRRDLFRIGGDARKAARWARIEQRAARVLDRQRLMALVFTMN
jgi:hypothetical protein